MVSAHSIISRNLAPSSILIVALALVLALLMLADQLVVGATAAHATSAVYCVGPGSGDPTSGCANPNYQDFSDINQALAVAASGDLINVASGPYPAVTIAQSVTITGGYPGGPGGYCCSANPAGSTISSGGGGPAITVISGSPTINYINESDGVVVTGGALNVATDGTSQGNYDISSGGQVNFVNGTRTLADGTTFTGAGFGRAAGASVVVTGVVTAANFEVASGPFATPALTGPGLLSVTGTLSWTGGDIGSSSGSISIASGATLAISGSNVRVQRQNTINNSGTTVITGSYGFAQSDNAIFNNLAGALFDNQSDAGVGLFPFESGNRTFNNYGTFRKSAGSGQTVVESTFTNNGTLDAESGMVKFDNGFTNNSAITAAPGTTISLTNAPNTLNDGSTITGTGSTIVVGSVTINGNVSADTLTLPTSGILDDEGTLNVTNTFTWTGGSLNGPGIVNIPSGKTMDVTGPDVRVQRANTINNSGSILMSSTYGMGQSGGATLNNLAGGLIDVQSDGGLGLSVFESGGRTLNNSGIVRKSSGTGQTLIESFFTNSGTLDVESGNVKFDGGFIGNSPITLASGTTLTWINSPNTLNGGTTISGPGSAIITNGTLTTEGAVSADNLTLSSSGNLVTDTGSTLTIGQSLIWAGSNLGGIGTIAISPSATMAITTGGVQRQSTINNAGTATVNGYFYQSNGAVFNTLAGGTFDLQADVGVGLFAFESGTRTITNAGTFKKSAGTGTSTVGATFTNTGSIQALSGTLYFTDVFTQNAGSLVLNGGNVTTNSPLDVEGGTVSGTGTITGSLTSSGVVSPGFSPGAMTITGSYTQNAGGTLDEEIGGLTAGTQFDQLTVNGTATLGGTLNLSLVNSYLPNDSDSFAILNDGSTSGTFETVNQPAGLASGQSFLIAYNPTNVTLVFQAAPPSETPTVTSSPTSTPTVTPTVRATRTRVPSATRTSTSTRTPRPTITPRLTNTPRPTLTPRPTVTGRPTRTPTQTGGGFADLSTSDPSTVDSNGPDLTTPVGSTAGDVTNATDEVVSQTGW